MPMTMPKKTKGAVKPAKTLKLIVRLTSEGLDEAEAQIRSLKQQFVGQSAKDFSDLVARLRQRSGYTSEEEVLADVEEAREELWRERQARLSP